MAINNSPEAKQSDNNNNNKKKMQTSPVCNNFQINSLE